MKQRELNKVKKICRVKLWILHLNKSKISESSIDRFYFFYSGIFRRIKEKRYCCKSAEYIWRNIGSVRKWKCKCLWLAEIQHS